MGRVSRGILRSVASISLQACGRSSSSRMSTITKNALAESPLTLRQPSLRSSRLHATVLGLTSVQPWLSVQSKALHASRLSFGTSLFGTWLQNLEDET